MADALFEIDVARIERRLRPCGGAEVGARGHDAEHAGEPRHAHAVRRMRRLAGVADDAEHVVGRELEDRQPVEDLAARDAHPVVAPPWRLPCARRTLLGAHAHGVDQPSAEARVGLEVLAKLPLDGSPLRRAGTPSNRWGRKPAPFLDAVEQRLARRDGCEDQGMPAGRVARMNSTVPGHSTSTSGA